MAYYSAGYGGSADFLPGSSGYWADFGNRSPQGPRPGLGLPGDRYRIAMGQRPLAPGYAPAGYNALAPRQLGPTPFGQGPAQTPGFQTVSNTKSPAFQTALQNALAQVNTTSFNPAVNPNVLRDNVKNPALQAALASMTGNVGSFTNPRDFTKSGQYQSGINQGFSQADSDKAANRQQFSNFQQLFNSQTPGVTDTVNQENNAIGQWYDGGVQGRLDTLAAARNRAVNLSAQRALGTVGRNNALLRLTHGDGSYATQQALDTAGGIYADEARQQADLARENYLTVTGGQNALLGRRAQGLDYLSNRQMVPANYRAAMGASEDARLAGLGQMELSNNVYTTPAEQAQQRSSILSQLAQLDNANNIYSIDNPQADLARRTQLIAQLQQINNANNFYGLSQPYQPSVNGFLPITNNNPYPTHNNLTYAPDAYRAPDSVLGRAASSGSGGYSTTDRGYGPQSAYEIYRNQTGYYPDQDPYFSQESYDTASRAQNALTNGWQQNGNAGRYTPASPTTFDQQQSDYARRQALAAAASSFSPISISPSWL